MNTSLEKRWREAGITNDFVFGNVMEMHDNCKQLLQEILPEINIQEVTVRRQKVIQFDNKYKGIRMDLFVSDGNREYDIEMQVKSRDFKGQRARYYLSKMDEEILRAGKSYRNLKNSYVIVICPEDPFGYGLEKYNFEYHCRQILDFVLDTNSEIIFLNSKGNKGQVSKKLEEFFQLMNGENVIGSTFIEQIKDDFKQVKQSAEKRQDYMDWQMELDDVKYDADKEAIKNIIGGMRQFSNDDEKIFRYIKLKYPDVYTDEKLKRLIKEIK